MMIRVAVTIAASPAAVWEVVEPVERHVDWMEDAVAITFTGAQTRGVGTEFDCLTKIGPARLTDRMRITKWEPPKVMGIEHRGIVTGRGRFTLQPAGTDATATEFTWTEDLTFPWWMGGRAGARAARPVLAAVWRRNLRRLQQLVEGTGEAT